MRPFHKPVRRPSDVLDEFAGSGDPADLSREAHDTAAALLHKVRGSDDPAAVERLVAYTDEHGIDDIAEMWASATAVSVPGALWRLYTIRATVTADAEAASYLFGRGLEVGQGADQVVAGASDGPTPPELVALITEILRGAFVGDFAVALERAAAFCRVMAEGSRQLSLSDADAARADRERTRERGYAQLAEELAASAHQWRAGRLN